MAQLLAGYREEFGEAWEQLEAEIERLYYSGKIQKPELALFRSLLIDLHKPFYQLLGGASYLEDELDRIRNKIEPEAE